MGDQGEGDLTASGTGNTWGSRALEDRRLPQQAHFNRQAVREWQLDWWELCGMPCAMLPLSSTCASVWRIALPWRTDTARRPVSSTAAVSVSDLQVCPVALQRGGGDLVQLADECWCCRKGWPLVCYVLRGIPVSEQGEVITGDGGGVSNLAEVSCLSIFTCTHHHPPVLSTRISCCPTFSDLCPFQLSPLTPHLILSGY